MAGFGLDDVRLLVCTHSHSDHYGAAATVVDAAGCELWMHPAWGHIRGIAEDPDAAWDRRIEVARQSGVPADALAAYEQRRGESPHIDRLIEPDRELLPGLEVETDLGAWQVHETPGHAPSHVVLHQPERRLMISGDHLLGRISVFFDYGHSPDPVGEFLASLDRVEQLRPTSALPDTGARSAASRPRSRPTAKSRAGRSAASATRCAPGRRAPSTIVADLLGDGYSPQMAAWGLQVTLAHLDHLAALGEAQSAIDGDQKIWEYAARPRRPRATSRPAPPPPPPESPSFLAATIPWCLPPPPGGPNVARSACSACCRAVCAAPVAVRIALDQERVVGAEALEVDEHVDAVVRLRPLVQPVDEAGVVVVPGRPLADHEGQLLALLVEALEAGEVRVLAVDVGADPVDEVGAGPVGGGPVLADLRRAVRLRAPDEGGLGTPSRRRPALAWIGGICWPSACG